MENEFEQLRDFFSGHEQNLTSSPLTLKLRRVDNGYLDLQLPNVRCFRCRREELEAFALECDLPKSLALLTPLLVEGRIDNPLQFFYSSLTALSLENGYGSITLDFPDSRSFLVGTVGISYRGYLRSRGKSVP